MKENSDCFGSRGHRDRRTPAYVFLTVAAVLSACVAAGMEESESEQSAAVRALVVDAEVQVYLQALEARGCWMNPNTDEVRETVLASGLTIASIESDCLRAPAGGSAAGLFAVIGRDDEALYVTAYHVARDSYGAERFVPLALDGRQVVADDLLAWLRRFAEAREPASVARMAARAELGASGVSAPGYRASSEGDVGGAASCEECIATYATGVMNYADSDGFFFPFVELLVKASRYSSANEFCADVKEVCDYPSCGWLAGSGDTGGGHPFGCRAENAEDGEAPVVEFESGEVELSACVFKGSSYQCCTSLSGEECDATVDEVGLPGRYNYNARYYQDGANVPSGEAGPPPSTAVTANESNCYDVDEQPHCLDLSVIPNRDYFGYQPDGGYQSALQYCRPSDSCESGLCWQIDSLYTGTACTNGDAPLPEVINAPNDACEAGGSVASISELVESATTGAPCEVNEPRTVDGQCLFHEQWNLCEDGSARSCYRGAWQPCPDE